MRLLCLISPQAILSGNSHVVIETHYAAAAARAAVVNLNTHLVARECAAPIANLIFP